MKLKEMTQLLLDEHEFTQGSLADAVKSRGVKCSQPTIGRILKGTDPSYSIGDAIREIYCEKHRESEVAA